MRPVLLALLALVGLLGDAAAQPEEQAARVPARVEEAPGRSARSCLMADGTSLDARTLFRRTYGLSKNEPAAPSAPEAPPPTGAAADNGVAPRAGWLLRQRSQFGVSGRHIEVLVQQPVGATRISWEAIELIAAARPSDQDIPLRTAEGVFARFVRDAAGRVAEEGGMAVLRIDLPALGAFWTRPTSAYPFDSWEFIVALCNVNKESMIGWADHGASTGSTRLIAAGTAVVLLLLLLATLVAATVAHRQVLVRLWQAGPRRDERPEPSFAWCLARMVHPAALTQTAEGEASLGRFQILVFTFVVIGALLVVFFSTFSIPVLSGDILALLGITALGSFGARVAANSGSVSTLNTSWLAGKGILTRRTTLPRFTDLMIADGEVDFTRVQALFFTLLVCFSLALSGTADLAGFTVPAQTMQLLGLSQLTYVAGKAIPAEIVKRLNSEIDALRAAERQVIEHRARRAALAATAALPPEDRLAEETRVRDGIAQAEARWADARAAAELTLESVYGTRFDPAALRASAP